MGAERNIKHFTVIMSIFALHVGYKYKQRNKRIKIYLERFLLKHRKIIWVSDDRKKCSRVLYLHIVGGPDNPHTIEVHYDNYIMLEH